MTPSERRTASVAALLVVASAAVVLAKYGNGANLVPVALVASAGCWLAVLTMAALGSGIRLVRRALPALEVAAATAVSLAVGAGILAMSAFILGVTGILGRWTLAVVLVGAIVLGVAPVRELWRGITVSSPRWSIPSLLLVLIAAVTLLAACTDSAFYDQLNYHVALPFHWLRAGSLVVFPRHDYSFLPANVSLLYSYALAFLGPWGAQVVYWWTGVLAAALAGLLAAAFAGPRAGGWAAVIFAATPAVALSATWAASDLGAAAFAGAAWLIVTQAALRREVTPLGWVVAGVLAGLAVGAKLLTLATVVAPLAVAVLCLPRGPERWSNLRRALLVGAGAAIAFLPWAGRAMLMTGNPLYPLFSGSAVTPTPVAVATLGHTPGWDLAGVFGWLGARVGAFALGTFTPRGAAGNIGPVYLFLLPLVALWAILDRRGRALAVGVAAAVLGWSLLPPLGRYLVAPLVVLAALGAAAWERVAPQWPRGVAAAARTLLVLGVVLSAAGALTGEAVSRVACTLGVADRDEWRRHAIDYLEAAEFINRELPDDARLLLVAEARTLYIDRAIVVEDPFHRPLLAEMAVRLGTPEALVGWLRAEGITHVLVNWGEAERMAQLNHRTDYFAVEGPPRDALAALFRTHLRRVFADGRVEVLAVPVGQGARSENGSREVIAR